MYAGSLCLHRTKDDIEIRVSRLVFDSEPGSNYDRQVLSRPPVPICEIAILLNNCLVQSIEIMNNLVVFLQQFIDTHDSTDICLLQITCYHCIKYKFLNLSKIGVCTRNNAKLSFIVREGAELLNKILMAVIFGNFPNPSLGYSLCLHTVARINQECVLREMLDTVDGCTTRIMAP